MLRIPARWLAGTRLRGSLAAITLEHDRSRCVGFRNRKRRGHAMAWTTPTLVEICIGLEINGYLPAEF
jgi:coenzyme PQQ precursor peptide PqqA